MLLSRNQLQYKIGLAIHQLVAIHNWF